MDQFEINNGWQFRQVGNTEWMEATAPGTVHTDLMANSKIEDPFFRLNELNCQWIDKVDWEYKTNREVDKELLNHNRIALDFKGLDTYAEVFVNGEKVIETDNMFREYFVDVKNYLKEGINELIIIFRSPVKEGLRKYNAQGYVIPVSDNDQAERGEVEGGKQVSIYTRKAGCHFGWDWGPRLTTSGIWRPVYLVTWDKFRIKNLQFVQNSLSEISANLTAVFEVETEDAGQADFTIFNDGVVLAKTKLNLETRIKTYRIDFEIANPKRWWTNGLGEAYLYFIKGEINQKGQADSKTVRFGLRVLELVREKDTVGTSFYFKLNGIPVFMKGANYIPNDVFLPRVTDEKYRNVVNTAKSSNMNMLRVWGGGIYENDLFYDLCDEAGILIWQDFMFACAMFPGDEVFLENVRQEAIDNIKRLRNHPCIALWCGNNEILSFWFEKGLKKKEEDKNKENASKIWKAYTDIFHKILPEVIKEFDPQRSYWDSSPSSGLGLPPNLFNGDEHYWGVWWNKQPFETYATHIARFMSEYGFQSFPELKTIKQYALPEDQDIYSEVMKSHQRSSIGNETIEFYMLKEYKKPKGFESFLYVNQVLQAEGIKFALESHRRANPFCMGSLYWQINDCWPVASWSSTDYYQRWKALQYYAKKGFETVLVSPFLEEDFLKVGIVNDKLEPISGQLQLRLLDFNGNVIWEKEVPDKNKKNANKMYVEIKQTELINDTQSRNTVLVTELLEKGICLSNNVFYFRPFKELNIPIPTLTYSVRKVKGGFEIKIKTDKLAKNVYLETGNEDGFLSDNYFDLLPGQEATIKFDTNISEDTLNEILSIRTLLGAF